MKTKLILLSLVLLSAFPIYAQSSTLSLEVKDKATGQIIPARIEVVDDKGKFFVAEDALLVGGDCDMSDEGLGLVDLETTLASFSDRIVNPFTATTQFYSVGKSKMSLPDGVYKIRVFKGPEYNVFQQDSININGGSKSMSIELTRWTNMPQIGWYSSDDHLHIPRPVEELNPYISKMMQAEDIHIANLLQMGKLVNFTIAHQHAHGSKGHYREGNYILASGQENPRTHFLGHTITLGAKKEINNPEKYLIYRYIWEESVKQGAINGYAHANRPEGAFMGLSAHDGLAIILPHNLTHFLEVLQFGEGNYDLWYDVLNLGFNVAPTAGTDYPCVDATLPGRERFYTKVEGNLNYDKWIESVRNGKTFVTNGPFVDFNINKQDIGSEINMVQSDSVRITGNVRVNPKTDLLDIVEIVQNGRVIKRISNVDDQGIIEFDFKTLVKNNSWFAVRGYGYNLIEFDAIGRRTDPQFLTINSNRSFCHSAPIYLTIANTENEEKKIVAKLWLERLNDMENMLTLEHIDFLFERTKPQNWHAISKEVLLNNRTELLEEIKFAKKFFIDILKIKY